MQRMSPRLRLIPTQLRPFYGISNPRKHRKQDLLSDTRNNNKHPQFSDHLPSDTRNTSDHLHSNSGKRKHHPSSSDHDVPSNSSQKRNKHHSCSDSLDSKDNVVDSNVSDLSSELYKWLLPSSHLIHTHGIAAVRGVRDALRRSNIHTTRCLTGTPHPFSPTPQPILGPLPGIEVGAQFFSRAEMVALGIHSRWLSAIDYVSKTHRKKQADIVDSGYSFPLAVAIVLSAQHEDGDDNDADVDDSEDIVYTGEPAQDSPANGSQIQDQVMACGNMALKNSMKHSTPIRLIRGHKCANSYTEKLYTYHGLYQVVDYWSEKGVSGFTIFKFRFRRLPGQPNLVPNEVHFLRGQGTGNRSEIRGLVCKDLSNGLETIPIPVTNDVDDPPIGLEGFTYMTSIEITSSIKIPTNARGCKCKEKCTDPNTCSCAKLNSSDFPYVIQNGGRLIEPKDIVFECGPNCGCGSDCVNRTSQRGLKHRLEIYRTLDKGWGVRSWDYIHSGSPVCEYIGVLRKSDDLDISTGNEFIFEIDCLQTINEIGGREKRFGDVTLPILRAVKRSGKMSDSAPEFCLDAGSKGNIARFINHSCQPNLFVQCILSSHRDLTLARIVLFAADNIVPLQELTYDYGYELDSVVGSDGKIKKLACYCGATCCRKRLY